MGTMSSTPSKNWLDQYDHTIKHAGLYRRRDRTLFSVEGGDRIRFLHAMTSNDVQALLPRSKMLASILNPKGKLLADLWIYNLGEKFWIEVNSKALKTVVSTLEKYILAENVTVSDLSHQTEILTLLGPKAFEALHKASGVPINDTAQDMVPFKICNTDCYITIFRAPLNPTLQIFVPFENHDVWSAITNVEPGLLQPIEQKSFEVLRIEAGIPIYGIDMTEENLLSEIPYLEQGVSYTKGCYIGQETVARVHARGGNVAHRLMGVVIEGLNQEILAGTKIFLKEKEVGKITSSCYSPKLQKTLCMALIHRDAFSPGTQVKVFVQEEGYAAEVVSLPV